MVDEKQIAFRPAVEISYLAEEQQYTLLEAMSYNDATPSLAQAIKMKKFNQDGKLTDEVIGFIFQQYYLLPDMTVDKNVRMGADLAGNSDYREIIKAVGLEAKAAKYPSELSGGEQQRVSVARALAKKPKVLFLDEPTGALDEKTGRQVLDYICKLHSEYGFTIVMVTHNANIAEMANTVIRMNSGEIAEIYANAVQKSAYEIGW